MAWEILLAHTILPNLLNAGVLHDSVLESESEVAQSCPTLATLWTVAYQAPPSIGFFR